MADDDERSIRLYALDLSSRASTPTSSLTLTTEFAVNAGRAGASTSAHDLIPHDNHLKGAMVPGRRLPPHVRRGGQHVPRVRHPRQPRRRTTRVRRADRPTRPPRGPALAGVEDQGEGVGVRLRVVPRDDRERPGDVRLRLHGQAQPVHLWDAVTGASRASYVAHNHLDEPIAALSVAFASDGTRLLAGYKNAIRAWGTLQARAGLRRVPDAGT